MSKKDTQRPQTQAGSTTIADLKRAVEDLVAGHKKAEELRGLIDEAKTLAREWKDPYSAQHPKDRRPLLNDTNANSTHFLLAALVVELRRDHELLEQVRRHFPDKLEKLSFASLWADLVPADSTRASTQPKLKPKQKYDQEKRSRWHRSSFNSIEYQFGGDLEADLRKPTSALFSPDDSSRKAVLSSMQTCLDDILAGENVNMQKLEDLFYGKDRRLLSKLAGVKIKNRRKPSYDYLAVAKIMDGLLSEPRKTRKRSKSGRPTRTAWLNDVDLRTRVLSGIEARIRSIANELWEIDRDKAKEWIDEIAVSFLALALKHLPDFG